MNVLVVGVNGCGALGTMCRDALAALGVATAFVDHRAPSWLSRTLPGRYLRDALVNRRCRTGVTVFRPDLMLVVKGETLYPSTVEWTRNEYKVRAVNWLPDDPLDLNVSSRRLIACLPAYDTCYAWNGRLADRLKEAGAARTRVVRFGYDAGLHVPVTLSEQEKRELASGVCFCGTWTEEREAVLEKLAGFDLAIRGNGWHRVRAGSPLRSCVRGGAVYGRALAAVYGAAGIVLNLLREQNLDSHNMRTFEIPAAGAFQLSRRTREVVDLFDEDRGVACFATPGELMAKVERYRADAAARRAVADEGHRRLLAGCHTYGDRMKEILDDAR